MSNPFIKAASEDEAREAVGDSNVDFIKKVRQLAKDHDQQFMMVSLSEANRDE